MDTAGNGFGPPIKLGKAIHKNLRSTISLGLFLMNHVLFRIFIH